VGEKDAAQGRSGEGEVPQMNEGLLKHPAALPGETSEEQQQNGAAVEVISHLQAAAAAAAAGEATLAKEEVGQLLSGGQQAPPAQQQQRQQHDEQFAGPDRVSSGSPPPESPFSSAGGNKSGQEANALLATPLLGDIDASSSLSEGNGQQQHAPTSPSTTNHDGWGMVEEEDWQQGNK